MGLDRSSPFIIIILCSWAILSAYLFYCIPRAQEDIRLSELPDDSLDGKSLYTVTHDYPFIAFMLRQVQLKGGAEFLKAGQLLLNRIYRTLIALIEGKATRLWHRPPYWPFAISNIEYLDVPFLTFGNISGWHLSQPFHMKCFCGEDDIRHPCAPLRNGKILLRI